MDALVAVPENVVLFINTLTVLFPTRIAVVFATTLAPTETDVEPASVVTEIADGNLALFTVPVLKFVAFAANVVAFER